MGNSEAVIALTDEAKDTVYGVVWTKLSWYCSTPVLTPGLSAVDLIAVGLSAERFSLQTTASQNISFTATLGIATASLEGELSLDSLAATRNGAIQKFQHSLYLSVDDIPSEDDIKIGFLELSRSLEKVSQDK